jgi:diguanylate cyclase (GGDEF)-like protein
MENYKTHFPVLDALICGQTARPRLLVSFPIVLQTLNSLQFPPIYSASVSTDTYDRAELIATLFRETDRAQRMKTPLCLIALCIVELDEVNRLSGVSACDDAIRQIAERTKRILRSYDLSGRAAFNEILLALPGCGHMDAAILADRLRISFIAAPFHVARQEIALSACFGVASSDGRSPIVMLREAESAMQSAREKGPGSIHYFAHLTPSQCDPAMRLQGTPEIPRLK